MDPTEGTNNVLKDENEKHGGPLHFPADDELKHTDSMKQTVLDAKRASDSEHSMSLMQGIRLYPKAIAWSILISTCIAMEGYDVALVNNFYAFETFNRKYGVEISPGVFEVSKFATREELRMSISPLGNAEAQDLCLIEF